MPPKWCLNSELHNSFHVSSWFWSYHVRLAVLNSSSLSANPEDCDHRSTWSLLQAESEKNKKYAERENIINKESYSILYIYIYIDLNRHKKPSTPSPTIPKVPHQTGHLGCLWASIPLEQKRIPCCGLDFESLQIISTFIKPSQTFTNWLIKPKPPYVYSYMAICV